MKYKAKPVEIEAHEIVSVGREPGNDNPWNFALKDGTNAIIPPAQVGQHHPKAGDYLIVRADGDNYLCPQRVFNEKYEAA